MDNELAVNVEALGLAKDLWPLAFMDSPRFDTMLQRP